MTDRLTQLQDALDQLSTQFYSTLRYLNEHHPHASSSPGANSSSSSSSAGDSPVQFQQRTRELARDLVIKQQQIEFLIGALPGIGTSAAAQADRLAALQREMHDVEAARAGAVRERERLRALLDGVVACVRRV
ncbi:MAG: RNA polymerase II mediator complex subunit [Geoglossum simile]|nr:MAG: RNA polymerase II mediator complex subunit [Geoglossum simile]